MKVAQQGTWPERGSPSHRTLWWAWRGSAPRAQGPGPGPPQPTPRPNGSGTRAERTPTMEANGVPSMAFPHPSERPTMEASVGSEKLVAKLFRLGTSFKSCKDLRVNGNPAIAHIQASCPAPASSLAAFFINKRPAAVPPPPTRACHKPRPRFVVVGTLVARAARTTVPDASLGGNAAQCQTSARACLQDTGRFVCLISRRQCVFRKQHSPRSFSQTQHAARFRCAHPTHPGRVSKG